MVSVESLVDNPAQLWAARVSMKSTSMPSGETLASESSQSVATAT